MTAPKRRKRKLPEPRRRLNSPTTKATIMAAAMETFAKFGYSKAGMREIAATAGVSSTLLLRYFGSKVELFEAVLGQMVPMNDFIKRAERNKFGQQLASLIAGAGGAQGVGGSYNSPSIVALSLADVDAQRVALRIIEQRLIGPLGDWIGAPNGRGRALVILMLATGFALHVRAQTDGIDKALVNLVAGMLQSLVDPV